LQQAQYGSFLEKRRSKKSLEPGISRKSGIKKGIDQKRPGQTFAGDRIDNSGGGNRGSGSMRIIDYRDVATPHTKKAGQHGPGESLADDKIVEGHVGKRVPGAGESSLV